METAETLISFSLFIRWQIKPVQNSANCAGPCMFAGLELITWCREKLARDAKADIGDIF